MHPGRRTRHRPGRASACRCRASTAGPRSPARRGTRRNIRPPTWSTAWSSTAPSPRAASSRIDVDAALRRAGRARRAHAPEPARRCARSASFYKDMTAPAGSPFKPLLRRRRFSTAASRWRWWWPRPSKPRATRRRWCRCDYARRAARDQPAGATWHARTSPAA